MFILKKNLYSILVIYITSNSSQKVHFIIPIQINIYIYL